MWRLILVLMLSSSLANSADKITNLSFSTEGFGAIVGTNGQIVGTGFVVGTPSSIITCAHVAAVQQAFNYTFVTGNGSHIPVALEKVLPRYDLALFRVDSTNKIALQPLNYGDVRRMRPGDQIVYIGYNLQEGAFKVSPAEVSAIGVALNDGVSVDFIEFKGEGIPGYSGGPILNHKGEVVATMREAWTKRGIRGGSEDLVNRGFAIEPAMLTKEIFYLPTPPPPKTNTTNTISIRLPD